MKMENGDDVILRVMRFDEDCTVLGVADGKSTDVEAMFRRRKDLLVLESSEYPMNHAGNDP